MSLFRPKYSPDMYPSGTVFEKLKTVLRKAAARTLDDLWRREICDLFEPKKC